MRDVDWATWTVTLGWPVQGIWPKCADGTDINAVDLNGTCVLLVKSCSALLLLAQSFSTRHCVVVVILFLFLVFYPGDSGSILLL